MRKWMLYAFDLVVISLAPYVALFLRYDFEPDWNKVVELVPYATAFVPITVICLMAGRIHKIPWRHTMLPDFYRIASIVAFAIVITAFISFFWKWIEHVPRSVPPIQWFVLVVAMSGVRVLSRKWSKFADSYNYRSNDNGASDNGASYVLVVGRTAIAEFYLQCVKDLPDQSIAIAGLLDERAGSKGKVFHSHNVLGHPGDLPEILSELSVHAINISHVVVALPFADLTKTSRDVLLRLATEGAIKLDMFEERLNIRPYSQTQPGQRGMERAISLSKVSANAPGSGIFIDPGYAALKRAIEIPSALALIILTAPLLLVSGLLVLIDLGAPVLFWQQRLGLYGRPFNIFKLRTMGSANSGNGTIRPDNERLSGIGRFLRRTKLDELPQLFQILAGDMSFVGPRAMRLIRQPENSDIRLSVRPGVTGWAQVNGGHCLIDVDKLALDVWYLQNCSLWLDLQIIIKTLRVCISGEHVNRTAIEEAKESSRNYNQKLAA